MALLLLLVVAECSSIFRTANSPDQSRLKSILLRSIGGSGDDGSNFAGALARCRCFCDGVTLGFVGADGALLRLFLTDVPRSFFLDDGEL